MQSTLDTAMVVENAADKIVYDAARRGFDRLDAWRREVDETARQLNIKPEAVLDAISQRHRRLGHYGTGILGSIPDEVREGLGLS